MAKTKKSMTKTELFSHFSEKLGLKKPVVKEFFEELTQVAYSEAKSDKGFTLPGVGKLLCKNRKARMGRNPKTGQSVKIPAKTVLKFRVSKTAKDNVLG